MNIFTGKLGFDRPIFLVGCARSGTTALSAALYFHPDVGPKPVAVDNLPIADFAKRLLEYEKHLEFSLALEMKAVWYDFFGQTPVFTDVGRELIIERCPTSRLKRLRLWTALKKHFHQRRLFLKSPTHSFRLKALSELFPGAIFIAIHRNGLDVVNSWGNRPYGFKCMGYEDAIAVLARKWNETIDYLLALAGELGMLQVHYEDLVARPAHTLAKVLDYCQLDQNRIDLKDLVYENRNGQWQSNIPSRFHKLLAEKVRLNNRRLGYEDAHI